MSDSLKCLRCGGQMENWGEGTLVLRGAGTGDLEVELYRCPQCNKLEFFWGGKRDGTTLKKYRCSGCGRLAGEGEGVCRICGARLERRPGGCIDKEGRKNTEHGLF